MCLFGQLEKMMERIRRSDYADNTTVIIEGLAGMDDLIGTKNDNYSDEYISDITEAITE